MAGIIKEFKDELSKEERIISILNEARETAGVSQHINDYYMQSINELSGSHTFENGMLQLDDRGNRDVSMLEAIYDIAKDEDRSLEDRGTAGSIIANSMILWNATIGEDERDSSLELNFFGAVRDIDSHMELVEFGYMGINVPVGPYIEEDRKIDVETNLQYSVSINPQIDDYLTNEREKIVEKYRENCDRLDKEDGIIHSEQEKEYQGIDLPDENVQIDGNKIFEILNEAREKSDVSPEVDDYGKQNRSKFIFGERMSILPGAIMVDDRGTDDRSFINALYNIASDDNRSLEDRGVAAALIDNSVYVYEGGSRLSGPEDAKLEIRMNVEELVDKSEQNMYEIIVGTCEPSVSFGSYTPGHGFNEEKTYEYFIDPDMKADAEREQEREIALDNMRDILTDIYTGVGGNLHVYDTRDDVQLEFKQTDNYDVGFRIFEANGVERLMELANDPSKDEELRVTALACAISSHSYEIYEEIDLHDYWNTTLYTDVDLNKVLDNIDSARELIEQNKVVEISYTHTFENHDEYEREEKTRTVAVNAPTMAQKEMLDEIGYNSGDKIKEYFPGVDYTDITSSALAEKMDNDPDVIKGKESLSKDILWQQAEFINNHVIVIDRTDVFVDIYEGERKENPIKDLPNGTHYDVCIEKLEDKDGEIEINISFDKGLIEPMSVEFDNLAEERDDEYFKLEDGLLSNDYYSFKLEVSPDDFITIRDMVSDIAHEHSTDREEPNIEKDVLVNR